MASNQLNGWTLHTMNFIVYHTIAAVSICSSEQCFSTFSVKRYPLQQFWLLTEPMSFGGRGVLRTEGLKFEAESGRMVLGDQRGSGQIPDHKYILDLLRAYRKHV